jgi:hypothetical protein
MLLWRIISIWYRRCILVYYIQELVLGCGCAIVCLVRSLVQLIVMLMELTRRPGINATIPLHAIPRPCSALGAIQRPNIGMIELVIIVMDALTFVNLLGRKAGSDYEDVDCCCENDKASK